MTDIVNSMRMKAEAIRQQLEERQAQFLNRLPGGSPEDEWLDVSKFPGVAVFMATPFVIRLDDGRWLARAA